MLGLVIVIAICAANLTLGLVVLQRNIRQKVSLSFCSVTLCISLWAASNYITGVPHASLVLNEVFDRLAFFFAFMAVALGVWFTAIFPMPADLSRWARSGLVIVGAAVGGLSLTTQVAGMVSKTAGRLTFSDGALLPLYIACLALFLCVIVRNLVRAARAGDGLVKQQALYISLACGLPVILGLCTNLVIPSITGNWEVAKLGPLFTLLFVGIIAYTIVRHHLFDIHLVIARSMGYLLSLSVLGLVYALLVFRFGRVVLGLRFSAGAQAYLILVAAVTAVCFGRLRQEFDRVTTRLFHRDAYNVQDLYDQLNQILVSNLETGALLVQTSELLKRTFKAEFVVIGLKESESRPRQVAGTLPGQELDRPVRELRKLTVQYPRVVLATDYLEPRASRVKEILERNGVAVLLRLAPDVTSGEEGLGYVAFGRKQSGNPYTGQDLRVLDAVGKELIIAVQNALHFQETQAFNDTLQARVSHATERLRSTNRRLQELNAAKDDFVAMVSHQLRTPLTSIKGYISMVLEGDSGPLTDGQRAMLETSFTSSQQMVGLISNLLNLTRLKTGKFAIDASLVDLAALVQEEVNLVSTLAKARGVRLDYHRPTRFPALMLDKSKMEQVVMNFLDNAVHYTPEGGTVTARLSETSTAVECTVSDTGIGVPKDAQRRLFTRYYRAKNAREMRPDGTGIGLFMAKKVIAAQGGVIIFESEEGKGSTFGFRIPKAGHVATE